MSSQPSSELVRLASALATLHIAPERILQVECGDGDGALYLAREFPSARVRGVDVSSAAVRTAIGRIGLDPEGRIAFKRGKPSSLPYPDDMFDLVVQAHGPLHGGELRRVIRDGGHLLYLEAAKQRWRWVGRARLRRLRLERLSDARLDQLHAYAGQLYRERWAPRE